MRWLWAIYSNIKSIELSHLVVGKRYKKQRVFHLKRLNCEMEMKIKERTQKKIHSQIDTNIERMRGNKHPLAIGRRFKDTVWLSVATQNTTTKWAKDRQRVRGGRPVEETKGERERETGATWSVDYVRNIKTKQQHWKLCARHPERTCLKDVRTWHQCILCVNSNSNSSNPFFCFDSFLRILSVLSNWHTFLPMEYNFSANNLFEILLFLNNNELNKK